MLEVYLDPCTVNSRKVLAGLHLLQIPYNFNFISYFDGEHKSDAYAKINPHKTVPSATDGDLTLCESNAILMYAGENNETAYPKDVKKRAKINSWLLFESSAWFPSCYVYLVEYVVKPLLNSSADQSVIDAQSERWNHLAGILDAELADKKYLMGDDVSIADVAIAAPMHLHEAQELPLDKHPNLKRWIADIEKHAFWQDTQGAVDRALLPKKEPTPPATNGTFETASKTNGNANGNGIHSTSSVRATLNYTKEVDQLTELYFYETEKANNVHGPGDDPFETSIHDGWDLVHEFHLDKHGFSVHDFDTRFDAWEDEALTAKAFYPEVVDFLKKQTGAKRILVFDHTIRTAKNQAKKLTQETNTSQRSPVMLVHCDYTAESGPTRVQQLLPDEAKDLLSRRVAFFNVWKPLHRTVEENPLAMCDVTTSPMEDFFKLHLRYRDRNGENYVMKKNASHKWWYFPKMTTDKCIILKTYESDSDGRARFVGHSAFTDPTSPEGAPMRESIEIRTIAFF